MALNETLVPHVINGETYWRPTPIDTPTKNVPSPEILDLPQMTFAEAEQTQETDTVTSNGVPLLDLPTMNFDEAKQAEPKKTTSDYMAKLPTTDGHE